MKFCSSLAQTIHKVPVFVSGPLLPRRYSRVITAPVSGFGQDALMPRPYGPVNSLIEELLIELAAAARRHGSAVEPAGMEGKDGPLDTLNGAQAMSAMKSTLPPEASV